MPEERKYQSQVAPRAVQTGIMRDARDYGAGVGAALSDAASTAHQLQLRSYRLDRQENADSEAAEFGRRFAQLRMDTDSAVREARTSAAAGAKGHAQAVMDRLEKQREALFDGITEDNVRRGGEAQFLSYIERVQKSEGDFEEGRRVDKLVTDKGREFDLSQNRMRTSAGDKEIYDEELTLMRAGVEAMQGTSADVKDALLREGEQKVTLGYLQGLMDVRPQETKDLIMAGAFNDVFTGAQLDQLISGTDVEIRRVEAAAEREAAEQKAELDERLREAKTRAGNGEYVPDEVWAPLEAAYTALGEGDKVADVQGQRSDSGFAKIYENATPLQLERRSAELRAKGKPSAAEQRELAWLDKKGGAIASKWQNDPFAAAQATMGTAPPPLDLGDPASVKARLSWQRQATQATGRQIPLLSSAELSGLQEQYQGGEAGKMQVLSQIDMVPSAGGARAAVARQIAPSDRPFQILAQLSPGFRRLASNGKKVLTEKGGAWFTPGKDNPKRDDILEMFEGANADLAFAMRSFPGEAAEVQKVAVQIAAGALAGEGGDGDNLNGVIYRKAIRAALGGQNGTGGLGRWNGQAYIIADGFTPGGFEAAIMRDLRAKGKNPPVNPDGTMFDLKRATPVFVGNGRYQWERGGALVKTKDGSPFISEVVAGK